MTRPPGEESRNGNVVSPGVGPGDSSKDELGSPGLLYPCPSCGKRLDRSTGVSEEGEYLKEEVEPRPGDITVCVYCSEVLTFTEDMQLRQATPDEVLELGLLALSRAQYVAKLFRKLKDKP